jgi:hypothetical protein
MIKGIVSEFSGQAGFVDMKGNKTN